MSTNITVTTSATLSSNASASATTVRESSAEKTSKQECITAIMTIIQKTFATVATQCQRIHTYCALDEGHLCMIAAAFGSETIQKIRAQCLDHIVLSNEQLLHNEEFQELFPVIQDVCSQKAQELQVPYIIESLLPNDVNTEEAIVKLLSLQNVMIQNMAKTAKVAKECVQVQRGISSLTVSSVSSLSSSTASSASSTSLSSGAMSTMVTNVLQQDLLSLSNVFDPKALQSLQEVFQKCDAEEHAEIQEQCGKLPEKDEFLIEGLRFIHHVATTGITAWNSRRTLQEMFHKALQETGKTCTTALELLSLPTVKQLRAICELHSHDIKTFLAAFVHELQLENFPISSSAAATSSQAASSSVGASVSTSTGALSSVSQSSSLPQMDTTFGTAPVDGFHFSAPVAMSSAASFSTAPSFGSLSFSMSTFSPPFTPSAPELPAQLSVQPVTRKRDDDMDEDEKVREKEHTKRKRA